MSTTERRRAQMEGVSMNRNQITEEVQELRGRLQEIKDRKSDGLYPVEDAMEKAHITVCLAELWSLWQEADWDYSNGSSA